MMDDLSIVARRPDSRPIATITPAGLADLMLVAPLAHRTSVALVERDGDTAVVSILRGAVVIAEIRVPATVADAAVARLAVIAGLDPLVPMRSFQRSPNLRRVKVRSAHEVAEVLVSVGASDRGLEAEVRALIVNGSVADHRAPGQLRRCTRCGALQPGARRACEHDGGALAEVEDAPTPGGTIGVYRILSSLGEGSGGSVFAGEHAFLGRRVAIKLLHGSLAAEPDMAHRFLSEARMASRLRHPSIVEVTDFGILLDGRPYMVMEHLVGEPLGAWLHRAGPLPPASALRLAREMARALGAAHDAGTAHNDLKPSNVILLEGSMETAPRLKLIDFGCAARLGTAEDCLFGTPGYMAPERIIGRSSDGRADLYSLGIMLYEMLTGRGPFDDLTAKALLVAQVRGVIPPLISPLGPLTPAVPALVTRAIATAPEKRYQTAGEMIADIDRALDILSHEASRRSCP